MPLRFALHGCLLALVVAPLVSGCAHKGAATGPVVKSLKIEGNQEVSDDDITDHIATSETSWWNPFAAKKRFDANVWSTDLQRIERYYHARGFYQAQVLGSEVKPTGEDEVKITVRVREGPPTRVAKVSIDGLGGLPPATRKDILRHVPLRVGQIFREDAWESFKGGIVDNLKSRGYAEASASGEAKVDLGTHEAFIDVKVDPGARYHPGEVHVKVPPHARVEAWRIKEQVEEALKGEKWWTEDVRHEAQQRVFNMGVFGAAEVNALQGDPATQRVPLEVTVSEAPYHDVAFGVGVGIEQRRDEGHVTGRYVNRDFLGGLRKLTLDARAGWAFIPNAYTVLSHGSAVTRSGPLGDLSAEVEQPRLWSPNWRLRTHLEVQKDIQPAYSYYGGNARVVVPYTPWTWLRFEPSYNFEVYRLTSGTATLTEGAPPQLLFGCNGTCVLSFLEERVAFDHRDDPQEPREGTYLALALQQGGGPLGGTFDYVRVVPEVRGYKSFLLDKRLTFAGRLKVGTLIPLSGDALSSPIVARFFSGGDEMRGFSTQRLSPMQIEQKTTTSGPYNGEPVPIGGNGLFEASFETRYHLTRALIVAGFLDTGFVTSEQVRWTDPSYFTKNLLYAVGGGIRYVTPVGPVRLDLAYRLPFGPPLQVYNPPGSGLTYLPAAGCFGIGHGSPTRGGAPESPCSFHLSIGEAF